MGSENSTNEFGRRAKKTIALAQRIRKLAPEEKRILEYHNGFSNPKDWERVLLKRLLPEVDALIEEKPYSAKDYKKVLEKAIARLEKKWRKQMGHKQIKALPQWIYQPCRKWGGKSIADFLMGTKKLEFLAYMMANTVKYEGAEGTKELTQ